MSLTLFLIKSNVKLYRFKDYKRPEMNKIQLFKVICSVSFIGLIILPVSAEVKKPIVVQRDDGFIREKNLDGTKTVTTPDGNRIKIPPGDSENPKKNEEVIPKNIEGSKSFIKVKK